MPLTRQTARSRPTRDWTVADFQQRPALRPDLRSALEEATRRGQADIVLRSKGREAVLLVAHGKLAWAATGGDSSALTAVFVRRTGLSPAALRDVLTEAQSSGQHFAHLLVDRGVLDRASVRSVLLEHLARRLLVINESFVDAVPELIGAQRRATPDSLSMFSVLQVLAQYELLRGQSARSEARSERTEGTTRPAQRDAIDEVMRWRGAMGAAVLDGERGLVRRAVSAVGGLDMMTTAARMIDVVRAQQRMARSLGADDDLEDMLFTLGGRYHLVRFVPGSSLAIFVVLDRRHSNLGLARLGLAELVADLRD